MSVVREETRRYVSQSDVPAFSLEQALRVATAIVDNYGGRPVTPIRLAAGMMMQPTSGTFRALCGASIAYGLTQGGYNAQEISIEPLARRILRPLVDGDETVAMREALLKPRIIREFLDRYNGSPLPRQDIAHNVLADMGVPHDRTSSVLDLIRDGAAALGLISSIKGREYVDLQGTSTPVTVDLQSSESISVSNSDNAVDDQIPERPVASAQSHASALIANASNKRVFVTHGKNREFIEPIKKLLAFGELTAVVSVENSSVSKPLPSKVMDEMRSCGAAIIHVDAEEKMIDRDAKEQIVLNPNVLIEIGAAMALFGQRFILLVREGISLPSNLQGLFEVRYSGNALDGDATLRLLGAINDIKRQPQPTRESQESVLSSER